MLLHEIILGELDNLTLNKILQVYKSHSIEKEKKKEAPLPHANKPSSSSIPSYPYLSFRRRPLLHLLISTIV